MIRTRKHVDFVGNVSYHMTVPGNPVRYVLRFTESQYRTERLTVAQSIRRTRNQLKVGHSIRKGK